MKPARTIFFSANSLVNYESEFPLYFVECMEFFLNKLGSRITYKQNEQSYVITSADPSITFKKKSDGVFEYLCMCLNDKIIASSIGNRTMLHVSLMLKELEPESHGETINFNFGI